MKTIFKWFFRIALALVALAIVLVVVFLLAKDSIAKSLAEKNLRDNTGMDARIAKLDVGLMTPTINIEGLRIYNAPEFGGGTFFEMPELRVEYVPDDVRAGKLRFKTVRLNISEVTIVKSADGKLNMEAIDKELKKKSRGEKKRSDTPGVDFGGIDTLYVTIGRIRMIDLGNPKNNFEQVVGMKDVKGQNLKTEDELKYWLTLQIGFALAQQSSASGKPVDINTLLKFFGGNSKKAK
jgi:hypothetical protein